MYQKFSVVDPGSEHRQSDFRIYSAEKSYSPSPKISFSQALTLVPIFKKTGISVNGNEPQAMSEDLILDNGCVVVHQDLFHSHGWHLPNKTIIYQDINSLLADIGRERPLPLRILDENFTNEQEKCSAEFQEN